MWDGIYSRFIYVLFFNQKDMSYIFVEKFLVSYF